MVGLFKRNDRLKIEKEVLKKNPQLKYLQSACNETNKTRAQLGPKATADQILRETNKRLQNPPPKPAPVVEEKRELEVEEEKPVEEEVREVEPEPEPKEEEPEPAAEEWEEVDEPEFVPGLTCGDIEASNKACCAW